ncbi:MAG: MFS transporter [Flavobacteriales bacterium]
MISKDKPSAIWSWALYDFANSSFTTIVVTFIYGTYFTQSIALNEIDGTQWWSWAISITAIVVALLSPFLGAFADASNNRKKVMWFSTVGCVMATSLLFFPTQGQVYFALIIFVCANILFEIGTVFSNAYLPDLASKSKLGKVSGLAWGMGYLGGLLALVLALLLLVQTDSPIFGFEILNGENIRATNFLVSIWFLVFSLPFFLFINENSKAKPRPSISQMMNDSLSRLQSTFKSITSYKTICKFLLARLIYNDALVTIFAFGGIYAANTVGFSFEEIIILGIILNVLAGLGAFVFGYLEDYWGSKKVINWSIIGLSLACVIAILSPELPGLLSLVFGGDSIPNWFSPKFLFWCSAVLIGVFSGPNQSSSRSLMSSLTPSEKKNEFFGFYAFSGKATAFIGPLLFGLATSQFGTQQAGLIVVVFLFLVGFLVFRKV